LATDVSRSCSSLMTPGLACIVPALLLQPAAAAAAAAR
jgi:hypothetical protein